MSSSPPPTRSRRLMAAALLGVGLALLGAAVWLAVGGGRLSVGSDQLSGSSGQLTVVSDQLSAGSTAEPATPASRATGDNSQSTGSSGQPAEVSPGLSLAPAVLAGYDGGFAALSCDQSPDPADPAAVLDGELAVWQPLTLRLAGPMAEAGDDDPNPFLDFRLTVRFLAPSGRAYDVPGAFDGDGRGGGAGDQWAARFAADEPGRWRWCASFRAGPGVAVDLDPMAGAPLAFDGVAGVFDVAPLQTESASSDAESASSDAESALIATPPASEDADSASRAAPPASEAADSAIGAAPPASEAADSASRAALPASEAADSAIGATPSASEAADSAIGAAPPASEAADSAIGAAPPASEAADSAIVTTRHPPPATRDFFTLGRLEYIGGHYLKFRDGPYWIKTGTNSPENLLAYVGFDGAAASSATGFRHAYAGHVADWRPGDPTLPGAADAGQGIIGALNYLAGAGVNSVYFLPMNLGGDGQDTWPFLSPDDVTHYDLAKLAAWRVVFEHAQRRGIALHVVLSETEPANRQWLDDAGADESDNPAATILSTPRRLFYRQLVARFADLPAIKWNLGEESVYSGEEAVALAGYLAALDWAGHPIAQHNPAGWFGPLESTLGRPEFSATSIQYQPDEAGALVEQWRAASAGAGRPWVVDLDENRPAQEGLTPDNAGALRKTILYDALFSGAGGIEWYLGYHPLPVGGDLNVEQFRTRAEMWAYAAHARRFLEENTPFWLMAPADELLSGEAADFGGGEVLALAGEVYAVYLPSAALPATLAAPDGAYSLRWYDPRTGEFAGLPLPLSSTGGALALGLPPGNAAGDWVALVTAAAYATPTPSAYP